MPPLDSGPSFEAEYHAILDGLGRLRNSTAPPKVFGSRSHGFRLNPPLSEAEVTAFEAKHCVALPTDYKGFLMHAGNGGAGPAYGVFKLGEIDHGKGHAPWAQNDGFVGILSEPFPHTQAWNDLTSKPAQTSGEGEDAYGKRLDEWENKYYFNSQHVNGAIPVCHRGCALRVWLVITGAESGHVWDDRRADQQGLRPLETETRRRVTFVQWYRSWLDNALKQIGAE